MAAHAWKHLPRAGEHRFQTTALLDGRFVTVV
jgi:hypothetical protein